jgi:hypothetical protein
MEHSRSLKDYRDLYMSIGQFNTTDQADSTVTVCINGEFFPVDSIVFTDTKDNDVLDHGHPYLNVVT